MLFRSLLEPRSIKVIERTTIPVIKVQTKDTYARQVQLDITFDSPEHFGLKAAELVKSLMNVCVSILSFKRLLFLSLLLQQIVGKTFRIYR